MSEKIEQILDLKADTQKEISELSKAMTSGIRKWEKVLYPMMIAFIILAGYGFYLIYNITKDMNQISNNMSGISNNMVVMTKAVVTMTNTLNQKMNSIDKQMTTMNQHMSKIDEMNGSMSTMSDSMESMNSSLTQMNTLMNGMYQSIYYMGHSTNNMSSNLSELNGNIAAPMNSINSMIPWSAVPKSNNRRTRYPVSPYRQNMAVPYTQQAQPEAITNKD